MKRIRFLFILSCLLLATSAYGQNEKFKALFIYNFTNYIDWPSGATSGNFVIAVLGDSPIIDELKIIASKKKICNLPIEVKKVGTIGEMGNCNMVIIPAGKKKSVPEANRAFEGKPVLIISDNASSDFGINFIEIGQKQSFQISKSNIESHHLKVNSSLLSLGTVVN